MNREFLSSLGLVRSGSGVSCSLNAECFFIVTSRGSRSVSVFCLFRGSSCSCGPTVSVVYLLSRLLWWSICSVSLADCSDS